VSRHIAIPLGGRGLLAAQVTLASFKRKVIRVIGDTGHRVFGNYSVELQIQ
jgi:hypothetical protein